MDKVKLTRAISIIKKKNRFGGRQKRRKYFRQSLQTFIHFKYERAQNKVNTFAAIDTTVAFLLVFVVVASSCFKKQISRRGDSCSVTQLFIGF